MKGERLNFSTAPGQGSGWFLVLLVRATWKWGSVKVTVGLTSVRVSCAGKFWLAGAGPGVGGDLGRDGGWRNEANLW
jgi:hypothetical protein